MKLPKSDIYILKYAKYNQIIYCHVDTGIIERVAVRAVGVYVDNKCPNLGSDCLSNGKTPIWDGNIYVYKWQE